ncbi:glutamine amidotransferase [Pseudoprimorskyibacter insulae]|uniref:GMP synthase [glutamine-hydrolyzing] n=1 Tax=Pseudoprimorskyibacter insulae TaxID=1695997 RepID=A0A2R8AQG4_9RHOB|nr:glutamine amidotransferase [Pseudoprimorskyibacter insulae]SPF78311.1 GMP synthase [glutamine-hydrolyzing] [Pseudoprimorskyibacter insulae]
MTRFLILQLRPEAEASDDEYAAFLAKGGFQPDQVHRIRLDCEDLPEGLDPAAYSGVIVGGGPGCVSDDPATKDPVEARIERQILSLMPRITDQDVPFLGCCYGIGILGAHLGAEVSKRRYGEGVGAVPCRVTDDGAQDALLNGLPEVFNAFVGHKEALQELPKHSVQLLAGDACPFQMVRHKTNIYATQFHPEADASGFETRIRIYKNKGYFPPEDADALIAMCRASDVEWPAAILKNFVKRYG